MLPPPAVDVDTPWHAMKVPHMATRFSPVPKRPATYLGEAETLRPVYAMATCDIFSDAIVGSRQIANDSRSFSARNRKQHSGKIEARLSIICCIRKLSLWKRFGVPAQLQSRFDDSFGVTQFPDHLLETLVISGQSMLLIGLGRTTLLRSIKWRTSLSQYHARLPSKAA